jgi:hypothetical protein
MKVTKKKIEAILQQDERMKWVSLDMLSVEEWVDYAYQLAGRKRYV